MDLLGHDSDSDVDFNINKDYAKRYEKWRRGEEIQKLKDKYGDPEESGSSSSEEEDEEGKELTQDVERQFFKTLSCLKEKNPKIYDKNVRFFDKKDEDNVKVEKNNKNNEPTLTIAGYQRKVLLETGGQFSDNEENEKQPFEMMSSQEQEKIIKESFKDVLKDSDNEDDEQWGNLFTKRVKTADELNKEEEEYRQWLAGEKEKVKDEVKEDLKGLHDYWTDPKLDEGEKFLRDYILNKRYLENEDKNRIPAYDEVVHDSDSNLSADEDTINEQDEFEKKYNFRFEEPDKEFIKRYPRTLEQSMRKKDERRKKHREEVKQRKQEERSKKDEELKRLKTLKKKEIMEKIKKLQQITGNDDIAFQTEDLEGDFDPQEYDKRMSQIFNNDYYGTGYDEEKPEFPEYDNELEIEDWDNWEGNNDEEELHCEDPEFNMDCDYDPTKSKKLQNELIENSRRRKKRRKSKFAESVEKEKPVFDPRDKTFEQYVDEYYSLDYEDLIGEIPCRFKYRKVVPNDFGLSIEEILNASDQELNRWVSIKKITRRLPEHVELYDVKAYKKKAANYHKKAKCFPSLYGPKSEVFDQHSNKSDLKKKKNNFEIDDEDQSSNIESVPITDHPPNKKKNKKVSLWMVEECVENVSDKNKISENADDNITDAGRNKTKKKNKKEKNNFEEPRENDEVANMENSVSGGMGTGKKKRKKKSKGENNMEKPKPYNREHDNSQQKPKKRKRNGMDENFRYENKRGKFNRHNWENENMCMMSDERLRSYGLNPKKYKNKLKYKNKNK